MLSVGLLNEHYRNRLRTIFTHAAIDISENVWSDIGDRIKKHITSEDNTLVCAFTSLTDYLTEIDVTIMPLPNGTNQQFLINVNISELNLTANNELLHVPEDLIIPLNDDTNCDSTDEIYVLIRSLLEKVNRALNCINDSITTSINSYTVNTATEIDVINITIAYDAVSE